MVPIRPLEGDVDALPERRRQPTPILSVASDSVTDVAGNTGLHHQRARSGGSRRRQPRRLTNMADMHTTVTVIDACGMAHVPALLISGPSKGQASSEASPPRRRFPCEIVLGSQYEPSEIGGQPYLAADGAGSPRTPAWAKRLARKWLRLRVLDETGPQSPKVCRGRCSPSPLDRVVGELALPDGVRVVAGANPSTLPLAASIWHRRWRNGSATSALSRRSRTG